MSISASRTKISLRVYPNATINEVVGFVDGVLRVRISEPPVKGKANKELITFLSQRLNVSKDRLSIMKGYASRNKVIAIKGLNQEEILKRLFPG